jgi:hypothetical protein
MMVRRARKPAEGELTGSLAVGMRKRVAGHLRANLVGYVALFAALGGTSYAATQLAPGSVTTRSLANGAVTHAKLSANSVGANDLIKRSLTAADFRPGALLNALSGLKGAGGRGGLKVTAGAKGAVGPAGPPGADGNSSIVMRARGSGTTTGPHGASTPVPLSGASWTQDANDVNLLTGSMTITIPSSCTGSFGNGVVLSVDGVPNTFALAPTSPASSTVTMPLLVSEVMEPGASTTHQLTAKLANSCTRSGEDFSVSNVKVDVVSFH